MLPVHRIPRNVGWFSWAWSCHIHRPLPTEYAPCINVPGVQARLTIVHTTGLAHDVIHGLWLAMRSYVKRTSNRWSGNDTMGWCRNWWIQLFVTNCSKTHINTPRRKDRSSRCSFCSSCGGYCNNCANRMSCRPNIPNTSMLTVEKQRTEKWSLDLQALVVNGRTARPTGSCNSGMYMRNAFTMACIVRFQSFRSCVPKPLSGHQTHVSGAHYLKLCAARIHGVHESGLKQRIRIPYQITALCAFNAIAFHVLLKVVRNGLDRLR